MEHEIPTRLACQGSSEVVSVSKANFPASYILLIRTCNASSLFTIIVLVFFELPSSISRSGASCGSLDTLGRSSSRSLLLFAVGGIACTLNSWRHSQVAEKRQDSLNHRAKLQFTKDLQYPVAV